MNASRSRGWALGVSVLVLSLAPGCDKPGGTNAGLTNGPPPSASDKGAVRSDLPGSATPDRGEALGEAGNNATNGGSGAMGGGSRGTYPEQPKLNAPSDDSESVRATPTAKGSGSPSSAGGGTKPAETIQTGTPKGPQ